MAYIIVRGSEKQGGYVSMVEKGRVNGAVRTKRYVCGLGTMTMSEFKAFQLWAHSFKDQTERKAMVLASGIAIIEKEAITTKLEAAKVQKKTTVKQVTKKRSVSIKKQVRKHYPVPTLAGYKGLDRGKTHTQIMREKEGGRKELKRKERVKQRYIDMTSKERNDRIKELQKKKVSLRADYRHWDSIISQGGLYSSKKEKGFRSQAESRIANVDIEIKRIKEWR